MNPTTLILWAAIFGAVLVVCLIANEISYRLARWHARRTINKSALWDLEKRRGRTR